MHHVVPLTIASRPARPISIEVAITSRARRLYSHQRDSPGRRQPQHGNPPGMPRTRHPADVQTVRPPIHHGSPLNLSLSDTISKTIIARDMTGSAQSALSLLQNQLQTQITCAFFLFIAGNFPEFLGNHDLKKNL